MSHRLERGEPVDVLVRWREPTKAEATATSLLPGWPRTKRNALIRRADGSLVVRPYRGLRVPR